MPAKSETQHRFSREEPISGYRTEQPIGSGGYGEVWTARAPGGLLKAVKIVSGNLDAKRVSREMTSLNRIKEVRHPFLLSIERIEIVDGNLVIVTELADMSLKDYYEVQRGRGHAGIQRDQLLGFLRDAADVLDYIYQKFSLQHLDVKPENLLLVGDRVKVGDFGLVKNLYERSASLVDGLTPAYAPPEVFDGRPNRCSDQYSLAIIFQEMLTGEVPFDGNTAARLATQHLHSAPNLSSLPKHDQPAVARALSKDPDDRFSSCGELIDALFEATGSAREMGVPAEARSGEVSDASSLPKTPDCTNDTAQPLSELGAAKGTASDVGQTMPLEELALLSAVPPARPPERPARGRSTWRPIAPTRPIPPRC